jgi:molybdenum cofactor cytidylyltransferase
VSEPLGVARGEVALVVLAAGRGSRLGGVAKALLRLSDGATYLERIAGTARQAGCGRGVAVVAAPYGEAVAGEARRLGLDVVENDDPSRGMASSIALGFAWAKAHRAAAALLWPCDHPSVQAVTVQALVAALPGLPGLPGLASGAAASDGDKGLDAVVPEVAGRGGHPALIAASLFSSLAGCTEEPEGARSVLRRGRVRRLAVTDRGCVVDIDEPADLRALAASSSGAAS